jgi:hypothetical protein
MSKSLAIALSNLNMIMCHAFITNETFMPPPIALLESSYDEEEMDVK